MSLLLDALKKAAQDKIARSDSAMNSDPENVVKDAHVDVVTNPVDVAQAPAVKQKPGVKAAAQASADAKSAADEFEFTLDDPVPVTGGQESPAETATVTATHTTISDEALQLLIYKTNREYRKHQYTIWGSVIAGSVFLLAFAGLYFYADMTRELDDLQRKNWLALAALEEQTKIEENLTSLAAPVGRTENPPQLDSAARDSDSGKTVPKSVVKKAPIIKQAPTFLKSEKRDPVSVLLNRGWSAFQRGDHDSAAEAYNEVLQREARNRDALLGVAAIAAARGDAEKAREHYLTLLGMDPIDPHAHAGLANLGRIEGSNLNENRLRQLIEKQPDDAQLQFVLGNLYAQQNKWPQAQQAYFSAWRANSENADYAFNLAVSLDHLKKYDEAERFYQASLDQANNMKTGFTAGAVEKRLQQLRTLTK